MTTTSVAVATNTRMTYSATRQTENGGGSLTASVTFHSQNSCFVEFLISTFYVPI